MQCSHITLICDLQKKYAFLIFSRTTLEEYDDHLTQLEKNISLVQERALEQAETDSIGTWMAGDDQEYVESGNNSPVHMNDPDYVDVEGVPTEVSTPPTF